MHTIPNATRTTYYRMPSDNNRQQHLSGAAASSKDAEPFRMTIFEELQLIQQLIIQFSYKQIVAPSRAATGECNNNNRWRPELVVGVRTKGNSSMLRCDT